MNRHVSDDELNRALALFRQSGHAWSEHWRAASAPPPRPVRAPYLFACAAAVLVVASVLIVPKPAPKASPVEQPFVQIPYVTPPAPYERVEITRMDVPVAALIAAGFDLPSADPAGTVAAEVLLGQDGRAHAFRLLPRSVN